MKYLFLLQLIALSIISTCAQNKTDSFIGRIYILESQVSFFRIDTKYSASYYTINEFGKQKVKKQRATLDFFNDSTLKLTVLYQPNFENAVFILHYNEKRDYWIDDEYISAYRRIKKIKFDNFELSGK